ncbi:MAG TPA: phage tail length tape measure family protein [Rhodopila sp.]
MADLVLSSVYQDNLSAGMNAATAALNKAADAADTLDAKVTRIGPSFDTLLRRADPVAIATAKLAKAQNDLAMATATADAALAAGSASVEQRNTVVDAASVKVQALTAALAAMTQANQGAASIQSQLVARTEAQTAAVAAAAEAQARFNATLGVQSAGPSYAARAADIVAYGQAMDALRAKYNPLFAVSKQYEATLDEIAYAEKVGALSSAEAAAAIDRTTIAFAAANAPLQNITTGTKAATASSNEMAAGHNQASFATRQLGVQVSQLVSGIATGQPVMMALIQQGHQVGDVMLSSGIGVKGMASAVAGMITPTVAAVAGAAALAAGVYLLGSSAETNARSLLSLQTALRATRDDFGAMGAEAAAAAKAVAASGNFSLSEVRSAAQSIASVPGFVGTQAQLQALILAAGDLATVMGVTLPAEAAKLAQAMQDPGKAAQELADVHFKGMNQALADSITLQAASGDKAGAFARYLDTAKAASIGAADDGLTPLQKAMNDLGKAFNDRAADGQSFADVVGGAVTGAATLALNAVAAMVRGISAARAALSSGPGTGSGSLTGAAITPGLAGNVLTNPTSGTLGIFQLDPRTAADLHVNPYDPNQNIIGGLTYLQQRLQANNGDVNSALANYGGYGKNTSAASGYIGKVQNADTSVLNSAFVLNGGQTMTATQAIQFWGESLGLDQKTIDLGMRIATVESGGRQFGNGTPSGASAGVPAEVLPIPPIPPSADATGLTNAPNAIVDAALKRIGGSTTLDAGQSARANIDQDTAALAALAAQGDTTSISVQKLNEDLAKQQVALQEAVTPADALVAATLRQADGQDKVAAAYAQGGDAVIHATDLVKAEEDARKMAGVTTENYAATVIKLTNAYDTLAGKQQQVAAESQLFDQGQQLDYLQAQTASLGQNADIRARDLAVLKEQQDIAKSLPGIDAERRDKLLANAAAVADATSELQRQQNAINEIGSAVTNMTNQLGQAITDAFVSGQGAAVNWGNVTKAIIASIIQEALKLAVINPLLNAALGQSNPTLGTVAAALGASSGGASATSGSGASSASLLQLLGVAGSANSLLGSGGGSSGLLSSLGLSGFGSGVTDFLSAPLFGQAASMAATNNAIAAMGGGLYGPAAPSTVGLGGTTIGSALGGVGLGFGAGNLVNSLLGGNQTYGTIGSGVGAAAGAAIGSIVPGVGTVLGGLLGGVLGGGGGGLFGPGKQNSYSQVGVTVDNGRLSTGNVYNQAQDDSALLSDTQQTLAAINAFLDASGLSIANSGTQGDRFTQPGTLFKVGNNNGTPDAGELASAAAGFSQLRFSSSNPDINAALSGQSFSDLTALQTAVQSITAFVTATVPAITALGNSSLVPTSYEAGLQARASGDIASDNSSDMAALATTVQTIASFVSAISPGLDTLSALSSPVLPASLASALRAQASSDIVSGNTADMTALTVKVQAIADFVTNTVPALEALASPAGTLVTQVTNLSSQFTAAIAQAQDLGLATDDLTDAWNKATSAALDAAAKQTYQSDQNFVAAEMSAVATISGNPQDAENAALYAFDVQASQQRDQLDQSLVSAYGEAVRSTQAYGDQMAALEQSLGIQRLAIQSEYINKLVAAAQGGVQSLAAEVTKLQTGTLSPLSPQAQYDLTASQFNAVSGAAQAGDWNSYQNLPSYADAFLSASQAYNGSGSAYAADYNRVLDALSSLASVTPATLTAAIYTSETRAQTDVLSGDLQDLRTEVASLRAALVSANGMPARLAS